MKYAESETCLTRWTKALMAIRPVEFIYPPCDEEKAVMEPYEERKKKSVYKKTGCKSMPYRKRKFSASQSGLIST